MNALNIAIRRVTPPDVPAISALARDNERMTAQPSCPRQETFRTVQHPSHSWLDFR